MTRYQSKIISVTVFCLAILSLLVASVWGAPKIKMASRLEYWDVVYREGEFDKKYGLEVKAVPYATGVEVVTALQSGAIDVGSSGHVPLTLLLSKTDRVFVLASGAFNRGSVYRMVVGKDTPYKTIHDLKGKVVATKFGSGSYNAFLSYIKAKGLKERDFRMENVTPAVIIAAMEAGTVDAGIWFEPTISIILYKGLGRVLLDFEGHAIFQVYWVVTRAFAEKHPDVVVRFLAGALDAQDMLAKDPKKSAQLISRGFKRRGKYMPPEVLEMGIPLLSYAPNITPDKIDELKRTFAFFKKKGRIQGEEPVWQNVINTGYLAKAQAIRK
ncbi:MAG: NrtA/SsuA/CpmA family ABC transporter substrate-binding protein [Deltaproteobacteria bacterium]|nr:NrtA/SsuA/CpmA family ABC transporter substrate-binding protein [Deltaproteobacteria bacterium]